MTQPTPDGISVHGLAELGKRTARVTPWVVPLASGVAGILLALVGSSFLFFVLGATLAVLAIVLQTGASLWEKQKALGESAAAQARLAAAEAAANVIYLDAVTQHALMADTMGPVAMATADMADQTPRQRKATFDKLIRQLADAVVLAYGKPGFRCVIYSIADDEQSLQPIEQAQHGYRLPATPFLAGTDRGDKALLQVRSGETLFVDDISRAPERWAGSGNGYNTFISAPITTGSRPFGLLTVDAAETDDLTEENENDIRLIAGLVAIIFAEKMRP